MSQSIRTGTAVAFKLENHRIRRFFFKRSTARTCVLFGVVFCFVSFFVVKIVKQAKGAACGSHPMKSRMSGLLIVGYCRVL